MLPQTMRAAVVHDFQEPLRVEELAVPEPSEGQVLVKIEATGVCHTDLSTSGGHWPRNATLPYVPGHEGAGVVVAVGHGAKGAKEGDRVGVPWLNNTCGRCVHCVNGWETLCEVQATSGYSVNGTFAQYCLASASHVVQIPEQLSFAETAPLLCAGLTAYKGLKLAGVRPGQWVAISGIGGVGHVAVQYARAMGMHVAAVDIADDKLELGRQLGAEVTINAKTEDAMTRMWEETGGVHGVLVTAVEPAAFRQSISMLRRGGICSMVGIPHIPHGEFPMPIFEVVGKGLTVLGSIVGTRNDLRECLAFAAEGKIKTRYEVEPLDNINDIFDRMKQGRIQGRVVMTLA